jgi:hypothetical protein
MSFPSKSAAWERLFFGLFFLLMASAAYLYSFPQPTIFYPAVVLVHAIAGAIAFIALVVVLHRLLRGATVVSRLGWLLVAGGAVLGLVLIKTGTPRSAWNLLMFTCFCR